MSTEITGKKARATHFLTVHQEALLAQRSVGAAPPRHARCLSASLSAVEIKIDPITHQVYLRSLVFVPLRAA